LTAEKKFKVLLTGGGTGGHLFPAIAIGEKILEIVENSEIMMVGPGRKMESQALAGRRFQIATVNCQGIKGKSILAKLFAVSLLPLSMLSAMRHIFKFKPDIVVGVGGYVTGPVVMAAKFMGVPTCIHEQNSIPGMANKLLGKYVDRIMVSIPGSESYFPKNKVILTGNPIRHEIYELAKKRKQGYESERFKDENTFTLMIIGGSQGAHEVNNLTSSALVLIKDKLPEGFKVIHQTGNLDYQYINSFYLENKINADVSPFIKDMASNYGQAQLIISRAGATSLAELSAVGIAAILIPYPFAADNHQEKNANYLVQGGAAKLFLEKDLTAGILSERILELINNSMARNEMAKKSFDLAKIYAVEEIVKECRGLAGNV
jgi:UDP-N-acetylglucosamine--N-acetylmuramyl-(pentapeptide) pyrophosphoryl-undecaprenol N-acetylglucosamine transferase